MLLSLSIAEIIPRFPDFRAAVVVAEGLSIAAARPDALDRLIAAREEQARARWAGMELSQIPGIAAWRAAYKGFGIKQTRYRSAVERIVKNVLAGRELARINAFVDLYNAVSLTHVLPLGADDLDLVTPPFVFRYARDDDSFYDMAEVTEGKDAGPAVPKPGEVVYADAARVLCRRWNWRQDARSLITPSTSRAIVTLQSNGAGDVAVAADDLMALIRDYCGGSCRVGIVDAARTQQDL